MIIVFILKPVNDLSWIISPLCAFHSFATMLLKENLPTSNLKLFLVTIIKCPHNLDVLLQKNIYLNYLVIFFEYHKNLNHSLFQSC